MPYPKIVVTGDSIAQLSFQAGGYGSMLCDIFNGKVDIVNRGMGGYNSRQLLSKIRSGFVPSESSIRLFIIHIGTNDSAIGAVQTISVEAYTSNLEESVQEIRQRYPGVQCILLTPSTLDSATADAWERTLWIPSALCSPRRPENTSDYVRACIETGRRLQVPVIDCFSEHTAAIQEGIDPKDLFTDGLHYSPAGYRSINDLLLKEIRMLCPDLDPATVDYGFESFWNYDVTPGSSAALAAPMFEEIRARAQEHLSAAVEREEPGEKMPKVENARERLTVSAQ